MMMSTKHSASFATLAWVVVATPLLIAQQTPSLGELAKKAEAERKATAPTPAKVYTTKDVAPAAIPQITSESAEPTAETNVAKTPGPVAVAVTIQQTAPVPVKDEAYWKDRMRGLVTQRDADIVARDAAAQRLAIYVRETKASEVTRNGVPYVSRTLQQRSLDTRDEHSRLDAAVQTDERAITALEDEAHVAGVLPGWLRLP